MFFGSLALLAQKSPHYQLDLELLVHQKRYIELERAGRELPKTPSLATPSTTA
jgi:hypothetical protein